MQRAASQLTEYRRHLAAEPALMLTRAFTGAIVAWLYALLLLDVSLIVGDRLAAGTFYGAGDFATLWRAGLLVRSGDILTLYSPLRLDLWIQHRVGGALPNRSWLYTPPMGLAAVVVSLAPLAASFWIWRAFMLAAAIMLLRRAGLSWWVIAAGLGGPVEFYDLMLGQNGTITGGVLVAALLAMERRQGFAGALAGLLCVKPQLAVLLPVALAHPRRRRALAAALLTAGSLSAAAVLAEGGRSWLWFLTLAQPEAGRILRIPFGQSFQMAGFTVFLCVRSLGGGLVLAAAAQGAATAGAGFATWRLWHRERADPVARMAMTVCLSMLAMPYGFSYDLVAFSVAMAALAQRARAIELPLLACLWFSPCLTSAFTTFTGLELMPLAALTGLAIAATQLGRRG